MPSSRAKMWRVLLAFLCFFGAVNFSRGSHCCTPTCSSYDNGRVRLVGSSNPYEGRVEFCYRNAYGSGFWGRACGGGSHFGNEEAMVVCRQLGYPSSGAVATTSFGTGSSSYYITLSSVYCSGSESTITSCSISGLGGSYYGCSSQTSDAGVRCQYSACTHGAVRLVGGSSSAGRVEVCVSNVWGTVCDDLWSVVDANVVCRQLGYSNADAIALTNAYYGQGSGPILLDDVACSGTESQLISCSYNSNHNCGHHEDAGVQCQFQCSHGSIRLSGGSSLQGRVEVCLNGLWGTVCDDFWGITDANVACRQLGYSNADAVPYYNAHFGQGIVLILLDDVNCVGTESQLISCSYDSYTGDCSHSDDAGVQCQARCTHGQIRLVGGSSTMEGRVEVCINGLWGTVCDDSWGFTDANVVCKQLGFSNSDAIAYSGATFGQGIIPILLDDVGCLGSESQLASCSYDSITSDCSHSEDAGVRCQSQCTHGSIRVIGGSYNYEGRIEVCVNGLWGTVCDDGWSISDAQVACKQLGYPISNPTIFTGAYFGQGTLPILLDDVACTGTESRLVDCYYDSYTGDCSHSEDAGVKCQYIPSPVVIGTPQSSSVSSGDFVYYQLPFSTNGVTIQLNVGSGTIICYASDTISNPSEDSGYDWRIETNGYADVFIDPALLGRPPGSSIYVGLQGVQVTNSFTIDSSMGDTRVPDIVGVDATVSSTLSNGQRQYFQFPFPSDGITIRLDVGSGYITCYASDRLQNPNEDQGYDWRVSAMSYIDLFIDPTTLNRPAGDALYLALEGMSTTNTFSINTTTGDRRLPLQTAVDFAVSSSVGNGELQYYQYPFPSNGLTVTLNIGTGRVYCYVSVTIQNPNEAQGYDWKIEATGYTDVFIDPLLVGSLPGEYVYVGIEGLVASGSNFTLNTTSGDRKVPSALDVGSSISDSIETGVRKYYQYAFNSDGVTITVNVGQGSVVCYASDRYQNPNEFQGYDWRVSISSYADVYLDPNLLGRTAGENVYVAIEGLQTTNAFTLGTLSGDRRVPTIVTADRAVAGALAAARRQYFEFPFPSVGITITLNAGLGTILCYASDVIQNPNEIQNYDWKIETSGYADVFLDPSVLGRPANPSLYVGLEGVEIENNFTINTTSGDRRLPIQMSLDGNVTDTIVYGAIHYFQLPFPTFGITVRLYVSGYVICYASDRIQNPNANQGYDWKVEGSGFIDSFLDVSLLERAGGVSDIVFIAIEGGTNINNYSLSTTSGDRRAPSGIDIGSAVYETVIRKGERQYFQLPFLSIGVTVALNLIEGSIICYGSDIIQNPNEVQGYVWKITTSLYADIFLDPILLGRDVGEYVYIGIEGAEVQNNTFTLNTLSGDRRVPTTVALDTAVMGTVGNGERLYFQFIFPEDGLTIRLTVVQGYTVCYASDREQNPNENQGYDWKIETDDYIDTFIDPQLQSRPKSDYIYVAIEGIATNSTFNLNTTSDDQRVPELAELGTTLSTSLVNKEVVYYELPFPNSGVTIRLSTSLGAVICYASDIIQNTNQKHGYNWRIETSSYTDAFFDPETLGRLASDSLFIAVEGVGNKSNFTINSFIGDLSTKVPVQPYDLEVVHISPAAANITWQAPPPNVQTPLGIILYYNLTISEEQFGLPDVIVITNNTWFMFTGLEEFNTYMCAVFATNGVGNGLHSLPFSITTLQAAPSASPEILSGIAQSPTIITLTWSPPPHIHTNGIIQKYIIDITEVWTGRVFSLQTINLNVVVGSLHPYYVYECVIAAYTVSTGVFSEPFNVTTQESTPTASPTNITVLELTSTSVTLLWNEPPFEDQNGLIRKYHVRVIHNRTGLTYEITTSTTSALVDHLLPFHMYKLAVSAETLSVGPFSEDISIQLLQDVPHAAPENISGSVINSTSIFLAWEPPPLDGHNGEITGYHINIVEIATSTTLLVITNDTEAIVASLHPAYWYKITISAVTIGPGVPSLNITVQTAEAAPSDAPQNVSGIPVSSQAVSLSWIVPVPESQNGIIIGYVINVYAIETRETFQLYSESSFLTIDILQPYTTYNCTIAARTSAGVGPFSNAVILRTLEDVPAEPQDILAQNISNSPNRLLITWNPPLQPNGIITSYTAYCYVSLVEYMLGDSMTLPTEQQSNKLTHATTTGLDSDVIVEGLQPFTYYDCFVTANTSVGEGNKSYLHSARTDESVPADAPTNLTSFVVNSTAIHIIWSDPLIPYGIIVAYTITYNVSDVPISVTQNVELGREYMASGLDEYTVYKFGISASTRVGPGPLGTIITRTGEAKPSGPPTNIVSTVTGSREVNISWFPPTLRDQNGRIILYTMVVSDKHFGAPDISINTTAMQYALMNLEEYNRYSCKIAAGTTIGFGPYSDPFEFTTLQDSPSSPPVNLSGFPQSPTLIMLSWSPPPDIDVNGIIQYYIVKVREVETGRFWTFHPIEKEFNLGSLHPYYNYECQVAGYTIGVGPFSNTVIVRTEETAPSASPTALTVMNTASDSFTITWEPPPFEEINGFIKYYVVSVTETVTGRVYDVMPNTTQATLDGLHPFYTYSYTVAAMTVGLGPHTSPMLVQLAEAAPATPPVDFSATAINSTTAFLSWSPPALEDQNGIIRQYIITRVEENTDTVVTETTINTDITFFSLHPDYVYTFNVAAVTVDTGPASSSVSVQTPQDAPSVPPDNFAVSATTANTISLAWDPPSLENQNGIIIEYLILVTAVNLEQTYQLSSITSNVTVDSLMPFSTYVCSVAAVTIAGSGPYSHNITVITNESAPTSPPEDLTADSITSTAIFLSWLPPPEEKQNGLIREYRINVTEIKTDRTIFITSTTTSVIVSSLHPFYKYECVVASFTIDVGPYTDIFIVKTLEDVPSGYPLNLDAELVTSQSAYFTWDPPREEDQNGNIIVYLINITSLEAGETFQLVTNSTSITVNALKPFTTYLCITAAGTHVGIGPFSTVFTLQTLEDAPTAPPRNPFGIATSTRTAYLTWTPPLSSEQNGIIRGYNIIIEELETGIDFFRESIGTSVEVDSLHPNYAYQWRVAALTVEIGPYSSQSNFTMPEDVPNGAPQNFLGKVLNSESIALSWEPPLLEQQNGIITGYVINISSVDLEEHQQLFTSSMNTTVRGLAPYTTYVCLIAASTIVGHGPVSMEISLVTSEEAPSGAPVNITGEAINSTHIYLQWDPPPEDQQLGDITGYKINTTELETGYLSQKQTEVTEIVIRSLHPYYTYSFAITASTSAGDGPYSASSTIRTHEDGPSSSPLSLEGRALSSNSILLSWEPPLPENQNGIIRQYIVFLEVEETGETITASSTIATATVTTLRPFTAYLCSVAAQTTEIGPMGDAVAIQTLEAAPSAPPNEVIAQPLNSRSLNLTWQPPSQEGRNGIIRQYTVIITEIPTGNVIQFMTNDTTITVESLRPFYTYSCVVAAETIALGPFSSPVAVEIPEDAPSSPPTSISVSEVTSTSFLLSWNSPPTEDRNGLIRHYIINITEENSGRTFQETSQTTEKAIEFLHPHYNYTCTIAAVTVATGPFITMPLTILTSEARPTGAPVNVEAVPLSQTSILISWKPPVDEEQNGAITGYTINITAVDTESAVQLLLSGNDADIAVENLMPFHTYSCIIAAQTSQGIGPFSQAVNVRTLEAPTTAPPEAVSHTLLTPTSILLTWNPPPTDHHNGVIQFYTVAVMEVETGRHYTINVTATALLLNDLHPFYNYHLAVAAVTVAVGPYTALYSIQTPETVPSAPPQNFAADPIDSRTLGLEWNPPPPQYHNGIIREYLINVTVSDDGEQFQLTSNTTQLRVNNLHPYYTYICLITAVTIGAGPFSEVYTIQMPEDAPTAPPQSLAGEVLSSTTISITWLPPVSEQQNGFIRFYTISVYELPTNQTFTFQRTGLHTILVVDTLHPYYEYELTVAAETIALGPFTTSITLQTNEDVPSSPPLALQGSAVDSKTIQLSWQPPLPEDQNGVIRSYLINVREEETDETYQLSSDTKSITASGLHPYYTYTFTIAAVTIGPGPFSSGQMIRTLEDVPSGPPHNVNGVAVSSSSIRLTWSLPVFEEQNGIIIFFYITIIELETGSVMEFQKDGVDMILIVNSLHPYYVYRCSIAASTIIGLGPSADLEVQTLPEAPTGAPQNLTIAQHNATFVEVVWEPPSFENQNGPIVGYILSVMGIDTDELLDLHTNMTTIGIRNLHPFYSYLITVSALGNGLGPANTVTVQLLETFPGEPIQSLMVEVWSPTSVIISWLPPSIPSWNGIITQYIITYQLLGQVDEEPQLQPYPIQTINIASSSLENNPDPRIAAQSTLLQRESVTLNELEEYYTYRFMAYVQNSAGTSEGSNAIIISLPSSVPSGSPVNVKIQVLSSTSFLIMWQPPKKFDRNGIITGYEVSITFTRDQSTVVYGVAGTSLSLHLEGLQKFGEYSVIVTAKTALGRGPYSPSIVKRTYEDVPGAPKDLIFEVMNTTAVKITWRAPDNPNGVILNYRVTYNGYQTADQEFEESQKITDGPHTLTIQASMQTTSLVLTNLLSGLTYEVKVQGGTIAGYGEYTPVKTITLPVGQTVAVDGGGKDIIIAVAVLAALAWLIIFIVIAAIFIWRKRRAHVKSKSSIQGRPVMDSNIQSSATRLNTYRKVDIEDMPLSIKSNEYEMLGNHEYETIGEFGVANRLALQEEEGDTLDSDEATKEDPELHLDDGKAEDAETSSL